MTLKTLKAISWKLRGKKKEKVFCVGRNKTGTTSLNRALSEFGFQMGNQHTAELFLNDYAIRNWKPILAYCETAQAFQDAPFSWPDTWKVLIDEYPNAKYILTIRPEESWYDSITKSHSKLFAQGKRIPTKNDLINAKFKYPGYLWDSNRAVWKTPENDPYNKEMLIANFRKHNEDVINYFDEKSNFLCIDVSKTDSYKKLSKFLNIQPLHDTFPHLNKT